MALPEHLKRLQHMPIDTLDLTESAQAVLKFYGLTHILDCIAFFCVFAQKREDGRWPRLPRLMFGEVKPALITAGYWDLVLDARVWRIFNERTYKPPHRKIVHWQGRDQDLNTLPLERLGITEPYPEVGPQFKSIGDCVHYFLHRFRRDWKYGHEIEKPSGRSEGEPPWFHEYMFLLVQPRLEDMGLWVFVEEHLDDFEIEEEDNWADLELDDVLDGDWEHWETFESDPPPFHHILLRWLSLPIIIVAEGLNWIAQAVRSARR